VTEKRFSTLFVPSFLGLAFVVGLWVIFTQDGTGDTGDSISHYVFARYAFSYPSLFLHHWAKPFFVLLAAPFAQLGFVGLKLFNLLMVVFGLYFTYQYCKEMKKERAWAVLIFMAFIPLLMKLTFSGLTEPLFAFCLIVSILLLKKEQWFFGALLVSFMPFVRSEGLIVLGVVGFYLLLQKQFRYLLVLGLGHVVYSVVGFFYYQDLFWVFNKIPYASLKAYGNGNWYHFIESLYYVLGAPIYIFLCLGLLSMVIHLLKGVAIWRTRKADLILVYGMALAYVGAHSVFWYFGIFNSMGLNRVLIGIAPLLAIIALDGFNFLLGLSLFRKDSSHLGRQVRQIKIAKNVLAYGLLVYTLLFPFFPNPAALKLPADFQLTPDQHLAKAVGEYVNENFPDDKYYYLHPYLHLTLNVDPFDESQYKKITIEDFTPALPNPVYIWDDWFAPIDQQVTLDFLRNEKELREIKRFEKEVEGRRYQFVVFRR